MAFDEWGLLGVGHQIIFIVNDALQLTGGHVQSQAETAGHTFVEPNVGHGHGQFDVAHALATDAAQGNFNATTVADNALVFDALVFTAGTFPVPCGPEDALAKQTTFFGFERAVIDGFRVLDLALGPGPDRFRIGHGDCDVVEALGAGIATE